MKSMRKFLAGDTTPPILECGEAQLQAALTMAARSRTPLPPSPTSQPLQESILNVSQISTELDHKLKLNSPLSDFSVSNKNKQSLDKLLTKPKPTTPLRKYTSPIRLTSTDDPHYEPVERSYDEIEYRSNAWQTLGVDAPSHTEQVIISN